MARTKFKRITIEYAGADLLAGGMIAEVGGALNGSTRYTTQAVQGVGLDAVRLDECGNLEGECSVSVAVDYDSEAEMVADILARQGFADGHQRGVLRRGIAGAQARVELTPLEEYTAGSRYYLDIEYDATLPPWNFQWTPDAGDATAQGFADALNDAANWPQLDELPFHAVLDVDTGKVAVTVLEQGAAGNAYQVQLYDPCPVRETGSINFSGGVDAVEIVREAGLSGFEYSSMLGGGGLRVVYTYGFIEGGAAAGA